jgi:hypothetical protein
MLQSVDIPIQKLAGLEPDGAPSMVVRNHGVSSLVTNDVKNKRICDLIVYRCLIHQENLCSNALNRTNVVTFVPKFVGRSGF